MLTSVYATAQQKTLLNVIVGNEGNFGSGNATLTNFVLENSTATDGVFLSANGIGIGDVVQSLAWINGEIYAVINNSQKVVIADPETFNQTGQISLENGASPNSMKQVSPTKAYLTDLYGNKVYVVDLNTNTVNQQAIPVGLNPDRIVTHAGFAYVANSGFGADSTIFKIDISTDEVTDTLVVARGPSGMRVDAEGRLWVVSTGYAGDFDSNYNIIEGTSKPGGITGIDLSSGEQVAFAELPSAGSDIALNSADNLLYVNTGGVRAFDLSEFKLAPDTLIKGNFYAMGYDGINQKFYLSDAKDFSSAGEVMVHGEFTEDVSTFSAGIIPGSFLFVYDTMIGTSAEKTELAAEFELSQNYPNPFNPTTSIQYTIKQSGRIRLEVFSITGQKVAELINGIQPAGSNSVQFDASNLSSGMYIYRLVTPAGSLSKKMMLVK